MVGRSRVGPSRRTAHRAPGRPQSQRRRSGRRRSHRGRVLPGFLIESLVIAFLAWLGFQVFFPFGQLDSEPRPYPNHRDVAADSVGAFPADGGPGRPIIPASSPQADGLLRADPGTRWNANRTVAFRAIDSAGSSSSSDPRRMGWSPVASAATAWKDRSGGGWHRVRVRPSSPFRNAPSPFISSRVPTPLATGTTAFSGERPGSGNEAPPVAARRW